jgi:hypothetical protein
MTPISEEETAREIFQNEAAQDYLDRARRLNAIRDGAAV